MAQLSKAGTGNERGMLSVLLARFSAYGDVAMTVPVVYSACRCYPDVRFVLVTRPSMRAIFVNAPANLTVVGADVKQDYRGAAGMRRLVAELVEEYDVDAFLDLHDVLRTRLMGFFFRLRRIPVFRINKGRSSRRALTRRHNKVMLPMVSQRARYREVFYKAGLPVSERFDGLYGGRCKADPALFSGITAPRAGGERWIGVAPFAAHAGKIYPPEKMEAVIERLLDDATDSSPVRIFLFGGGENESRVFDSWVARFGSSFVTSLAAKRCGFAAELALLNHLDAIVTMDSANMHLAAIAGTPTVSVWGATHPYCGFKGWRQTDADTVQLPLSCRPCSIFGNKECFRKDLLCLMAIRPDMIYKKVTEKIQTSD
jgi:ADP-heptose:LPS heptosyltransferase